MVRSINSKIYTSYCFYCNKMTNTLNKKKVLINNKYRFKGNCEECKRLKIDLDNLGHWD